MFYSCNSQLYKQYNRIWFYFGRLDFLCRPLLVQSVMPRNQNIKSLNHAWRNSNIQLAINLKRMNKCFFENFLILLSWCMLFKRQLVNRLKSITKRLSMVLLWKWNWTRMELHSQNMSLNVNKCHANSDSDGKPNTQKKAKKERCWSPQVTLVKYHSNAWSWNG